MAQPIRHKKKTKREKCKMQKCSGITFLHVGRVHIIYKRILYTCHSLHLLPPRNLLSMSLVEIVSVRFFSSWSITQLLSLNILTDTYTRRIYVSYRCVIIPIPPHCLLVVTDNHLPWMKIWQTCPSCFPTAFVQLLPHCLLLWQSWHSQQIHEDFSAWIFL